MNRELLVGLSLLLCPVSVVALESGQPVPGFTAKTYEGIEVPLDGIKEQIVVLEWFNPGCPFVKKHYRDGDMQRLQEDYAARGVKWLVVNSTEKNHRDYVAPQDAMRIKEEFKIKSALLIADSEGELGRLFEAKTTPHVFIINKDGILVYQGAIDDSPHIHTSPGKAKNYVREALDELLAGKKVSIKETKPYGCSVKYAE